MPVPDDILDTILHRSRHVDDECARAAFENALVMEAFAVRAGAEQHAACSRLVTLGREMLPKDSALVNRDDVPFAACRNIADAQHYFVRALACAERRQTPRRGKHRT